MSRQCLKPLHTRESAILIVVRHAFLGVITATFCSSVAKAEAGPFANPDLNEEQNVSQELANPVADLISVPFQNNFDYGGGQGGKSFRYTLVTQPVVPFHLNENWNLITRATIPFADVPRVFPNGPDEAIGLDGGPFANVQQVSRETGLADSALSFSYPPGSRLLRASPGASGRSSACPPRRTVFSANANGVPARPECSCAPAAPG